MKIYVGNLSYDTHDGDLKEAFGRYGEVEEARVIQDRDSRRSKGFGFVEMSNDAQARTAINELNDTELQGRRIKVNEARPREEGGGGRGGRGGGGRSRY